MVSLDAVQVSIGSDGHPKAVQIDLALWRKILAALEDADDIASVRSAWTELDAVGSPPRGRLDEPRRHCGYLGSR